MLHLYLHVLLFVIFGDLFAVVGKRFVNTMSNNMIKRENLISVAETSDTVTKAGLDV